MWGRRDGVVHLGSAYVIFFSMALSWMTSGMSGSWSSTPSMSGSWSQTPSTWGNERRYAQTARS